MFCGKYRVPHYIVPGGPLNRRYSPQNDCAKVRTNVRFVQELKSTVQSNKNNLLKCFQTKIILIVLRLYLGKQFPLKTFNKMILFRLNG